MDRNAIPIGGYCSSNWCGWCSLSGSKCCLGKNRIQVHVSANQNTKVILHFSWRKLLVCNLKLDDKIFKCFWGGALSNQLSNCKWRYIRLENTARVLVVFRFLKMNLDERERQNSIWDTAGCPNSLRGNEQQKKPNESSLMLTTSVSFFESHTIVSDHDLLPLIWQQNPFRSEATMKKVTPPAV